MKELYQNKIIKIVYLILTVLIFYYLMFFPKITATRIGDYIFSKIYFGNFSKLINHRDYYYEKCYFLNSPKYYCKGRYNIINFNGLKAMAIWEIEKPQSENLLTYLKIKEELKKFNENNKDFKFFFKQETEKENLLYITKVTENLIKIFYIIFIIVAWITRNYFLYVFFSIKNMLQNIIKKIYNFI